MEPYFAKQLKILVALTPVYLFAITPVPSATEETISAKTEKTSDRLLQLLPKSITVEASYTYDYAYNASGGIKSGSTNRSFFDVALLLDLQSFLSWENGMFKIGFQKYSGENTFDLVGDFQSTGSNDGKNVEILSELWIERSFLDDTLRLKAGKIDANTEFAFANNGLEFINATSGTFSPTIFVLTTSPDTAVGANLFIYPSENIYGGIGIYDGATQSGRSTGTHGLDYIFRNPGGLFFIGEVGGSWASEKSGLPSRMGIGVWRHSADFERFDGGTENGAEGYYIVFDKAIWETAVNGCDQWQSLDAFFKYGYTSGSISQAEQHFDFGFVMTNPFGNRPEDACGCGLTWVDFSEDPAAGFDESFELIIESFYKIQCTTFVALKAGLQHVINPGGDSSFNNATVSRIRVEATF